MTEEPDTVAARLYQSWKRKTAGMEFEDSLAVFTSFLKMVQDDLFAEPEDGAA